MQNICIEFFNSFASNTLLENHESTVKKGKCLGMVISSYAYIPITAPTSLIQTAQRQDAVDFATPLVFSSKGVFIKNPANVYNFTAYLEPLTYLSWALIGVFFLFVPCGLYKISETSKEENDLSLLQSFEAIFAALLFLGSPTDPNKTSTRIVFLR